MRLESSGKRDVAGAFVPRLRPLVVEYKALAQHQCTPCQWWQGPYVV